MPAVLGQWTGRPPGLDGGYLINAATMGAKEEGRGFVLFGLMCFVGSILTTRMAILFEGLLQHAEPSWYISTYARTFFDGKYEQQRRHQRNITKTFILRNNKAPCGDATVDYLQCDFMGCCKGRKCMENYITALCLVTRILMHKRMLIEQHEEPFSMAAIVAKFDELADDEYGHKQRKNYGPIWKNYGPTWMNLYGDYYLRKQYIYEEQQLCEQENRRKQQMKFKDQQERKLFDFLPSTGWSFFENR